MLTTKMSSAKRTTAGSCGGCSSTCGRIGCLVAGALVLPDDRGSAAARRAADDAARHRRRAPGARRRRSRGASALLLAVVARRRVRLLVRRDDAHGAARPARDARPAAASCSRTCSGCPIAFFDRNPVGRLVTRVTSDVESLNELFTAGVVAGLGDLFTLLAISGDDDRHRLAARARGVRGDPARVPRRRTCSRRGCAWRIATSARGSRASTRSCRSGSPGCASCSCSVASTTRPQRFDELNRGHLDANLDRSRIYALYFPAIEFLTSLALAILLVAGAHRVGVGRSRVGDGRRVPPARAPLLPAAAGSVRQVQHAAAGDGGVGADLPLLDTEPADVGAATAERGRCARRSARRRASGTRGVTIAFEDVWFHYGEPTRARRSGCCAASASKSRPGETLALVGHTGAGKTTIVNLLLRFYEPQRGRITANGVDMREHSARRAARAHRLRAAGHLPLRRRRADEHPARRAARRRRGGRGGGARGRRSRRCGACPHGYDQVLGERGASISVGERQLLSFARAIAADPALLVLDEATSAVDSEIEAEIQRGARGADARADDDRHRAPLEHHRRRGRDPRAAPRRGARARHARAAARACAGCTSGCTVCRRARRATPDSGLRHACQPSGRRVVSAVYRVPGARVARPSASSAPKSDRASPRHARPPAQRSAVPARRGRRPASARVRTRTSSLPGDSGARRAGGDRARGRARADDSPASRDGAGPRERRAARRRADAADARRQGGDRRASSCASPTTPRRGATQFVSVERDRRDGGRASARAPARATAGVRRTPRVARGRQGIHGPGERHRARPRCGVRRRRGAERSLASARRDRAGRAGLRGARHERERRVRERRAGAGFAAARRAPT